MYGPEPRSSRHPQFLSGPSCQEVCKEISGRETRAISFLDPLNPSYVGLAKFLVFMNGCPADPAINRRPAQIAMFFEKLISWPWKAGVPAASQNECDTKVAGTIKASSASAARRGTIPNATPNPAPTSHTLP